MTGFGRASGAVDGRTVSVEVKSVNSKQFDLSCKMPSRYRELEVRIKESLRNLLLRGKVELYVHADLPDRKIDLDQEVIKGYFEQLSAIREAIAPKEKGDLMPLVMRLPEVVTHVKEELSATEEEILMSLIEESSKALDEFRLNEGDRIREDMVMQVENITELLKEIEKLDEGRSDKVQDRLRQRINELDIEIDRNRFEQELIYYLEKLDVNEEKVRLRGHCSFYLETLDSSEPSKGKKLGFITQEMGREINTLGSKANDAGIQHHVVHMKENLEKLKEQVLNVL